ncbi:MAG TPA: class II aldolase/adducin family protein [Anaerolineaceae bacterium]|nr:class II aldolase/adducin family protein [Anaerolineaceae bacterium]HQN04692.1 class II aldolase/adducin family protein [Anaerolineaceae bacterium]HQP07890.1 class II aldolase/adducin family protein [Anaerolineaceae bacterium]
MMLENLRQEVFESLIELPKNRLVTMHSGTVSGRDPETGNIVIKPTGFRYDRLTPADLLVMDGKGKILEGSLRPSSDTATHLYLYEHRPDIFGIVHTHSPYACTFAVLGKPIPAVMTSAAMLGGEIPVGGYAAVGGEDIGSEIIRKIGKCSAIIMQNHGVYTISSTVWQATIDAVEVEDLAKIALFASLLGDPIKMTTAQIEEFQNIYHTLYGQKKH